MTANIALGIQEKWAAIIVLDFCRPLREHWLREPLAGEAIGALGGIFGMRGGFGARQCDAALREACMIWPCTIWRSAIWACAISARAIPALRNSGLRNTGPGNIGLRNTGPGNIGLRSIGPRMVERA
jgi:hypothetical protein